MYDEDSPAQLAFGARISCNVLKNAPEYAASTHDVIRQASASWRNREGRHPCATGRKAVAEPLGPGHEAQLFGETKCASSYWPWPGCLASSPRRRMLLRQVQASDRSGWAPHPALSRCGVAAARSGIQCPVIGANGGADGFRRIARQTGITATKVHTRVGEVLTTEAGAPLGVGMARTGAEATPAVDGAIPNAAPGHGSDCRG